MSYILHSFESRLIMVPWYSLFTQFSILDLMQFHDAETDVHRSTTRAPSDGELECER